MYASLAHTHFIIITYNDTDREYMNQVDHLSYILGFSFTEFVSDVKYIANVPSGHLIFPNNNILL
jgi:hypothetical protein